MGQVTATADLWYHYGRTRHAADRAVPDAFFWNWGQDSGPGTEVLGGLDDRVVGDLGAGAARHAAHLTARRRPARVDAIDASPAQHAMATDLYSHLAPRLHIVCADVVHHLRATVGTYDVCSTASSERSTSPTRESCCQPQPPRCDPAVDWSSPLSPTT